MKKRRRARAFRPPMRSPKTAARIAHLRLQGIAAALAELARAHMEPDLAHMVLDSLGVSVADLKRDFLFSISERATLHPRRPAVRHSAVGGDGVGMHPARRLTRFSAILRTPHHLPCLFPQVFSCRVVDSTRRARAAPRSAGPWLQTAAASGDSRPAAANSNGRA